MAQQIVTMQKEVGVAGAKALENAEIKVFSGGSDGDKAAFDVGKSLSALFVSNEGSLNSVLNRLARPNDLGINLILAKEGEQSPPGKAEDKKKGGK